MTRNNAGTGRYAASSSLEGDTLWVPNDYTPSQQKIGVVYVHGAGELSASILNGATTVAGKANKWNEANLIRAIAEVYPMVSCDFGVWASGGNADSNNWGNANAQARMDDAIAWLQNPLGGGARPGRVHLFGISMGHALSMNYAQAKPWKVASISAILPVNDTDDIRDNDRGGANYRQYISTAWAAGAQHSYANCGTTSASATVTTVSVVSGDNGMYVSGAQIATGVATYVGTVTASTSFLLSSSPTSQVNVNAIATASSQTLFFTNRWTAIGTPALPAAANPAKTANQTNLTNIPQKLWYANDDTICTPATVTTLQANLPVIQLVNLGSVGGHSDLTIGFVNAADVLAFLATVV